MAADEIILTILREFPYALYGSILVGAVCGFLGVYVVAKRVVFLGAVLTQVSVLGLALTFLPFFPVSHTLGSLGVTVIAVVLLSRLLAERRIHGDAVLGVVFVVAVAVRILVMQITPKVEIAEIENLLRGDILFVTPDLFLLMLVVFVAAMAVHLVFFKEFSFIAFDAETANTQGFRSTRWEGVFYTIAAIVISVATHMVGDVFVFGFLVIPPVTALLLARTVRGIFVLSTALGIFCPAIGLFLAFLFDFPSSPVIVAVAAACLLLALAGRLLRR